MTEKKYKRIGWIVETRVNSYYVWITKYYTFTRKSSEDSWGRYKYRDKELELKHGTARIVPVYVEVLDD